MGQAYTEMIPVWGHKHLRFVPQPSERYGMDNPVPITLEGVARSARAPVILDEGPAARS